MPDLPARSASSSSFPFVGRSAELEMLADAAARGPRGEGRRVVLLGGEPGSGKSRLVARVRGRARPATGVLVLYGACDAVVRTPYGPFVEALEQLVRATDPAELRAALGTVWRRARATAPDLAARVGELPPPVGRRPRHRAAPAAHRGRPTSSCGSGGRRPAAARVEDGHWADAPTLMLLRHLARAAHGNPRLLVLATFRDTEADVPEGSRPTPSPTSVAPTTSCGSASRA